MLARTHAPHLRRNGVRHACFINLFSFQHSAAGSETDVASERTGKICSHITIPDFRSACC